MISIIQWNQSTARDLLWIMAPKLVRGDSELVLHAY